MFERYFVKPETIDRLRASWLGEPIERYVTWLHEHGYSARNVFRRVPLLRQFGEFAQAHGATRWEELPAYVEPFVTVWVQQHGHHCPTEAARRHVASDARNPIQQLLHLLLPAYTGRGRPRGTVPFAECAPGFLPYLRQERGLREPTITLYLHYICIPCAVWRRISRGLPCMSSLPCLPPSSVPSSPRAVGSWARRRCWCCAVISACFSGTCSGNG